MRTYGINHSLINSLIKSFDEIYFKNFMSSINYNYIVFIKIIFTHLKLLHSLHYAQLNG